MLGTDKTITVYHHGYDTATDADTYTRTIIAGVSVYDKSTVAVSTSGLIANNTYAIRIPTTADAGGKTFAPPKKYTAETDKSKWWTVEPGDTVVVGAVNWEIGKNGHEWADIENASDYVCTVTGCRDRRDRPFPHIIIEGK